MSSLRRSIEAIEAQKLRYFINYINMFFLSPLPLYHNYLLKLRFQLPALSLNKDNYDKLMSVILKAALPRMHINRNTARSIIHGLLLLGGMALPHLDTVQGIDKLHLFLGHLRRQDDNGSLIKIDLTYVQLLCGVTQFIFN
jgi:hypothetical protein